MLGNIRKFECERHWMAGFTIEYWFFHRLIMIVLGTLPAQCSLTLICEERSASASTASCPPDEIVLSRDVLSMQWRLLNLQKFSAFGLFFVITFYEQSKRLIWIAHPSLTIVHHWGYFKSVSFSQQSSFLVVRL